MTLSALHSISEKMQFEFVWKLKRKVKQNDIKNKLLKPLDHPRLHERNWWIEYVMCVPKSFRNEFLNKIQRGSIKRNSEKNRLNFTAICFMHLWIFSSSFIIILSLRSSRLFITVSEHHFRRFPFIFHFFFYSKKNLKNIVLYVPAPKRATTKTMYCFILLD